LQVFGIISRGGGGVFVVFAIALEALIGGIESTIIVFSGGLEF